MGHVRRFFQRIATLLRSGRAERELAREIQAHLQLLEDQFAEKGMSRDEARYAARRTFGGVEQVKEQQRDARSFRWLAGWPMDLKLGARMLVKSPGLTVIAVIALAVAFGGGAAYLEFVNDMVRPTLSFPGGDRLIGIVVQDVEKNAPERRILSDFQTWRDELTLVQDLGVSQEIAGDVVTEDGRAEREDGVRISPLAFRLIPSSPLRGRPLVEEDQSPAAPPVAVIGEMLWQSRFDRDPGIIGRSLMIENARYTIVGVMPKTFGFPRDHALWVPFTAANAPVQRGEGPPITVFGRLAEGASIEAAGDEAARIRARASSDDTASIRRQHVELRPYVASLVSGLSQNGMIAALYAANLAFIALLGVCAANVATLVFGRTVTREAEITVRTALGASRGRIVSQLIAEALVLSSIAAVAGLGAARLALGWVRHAWEIGQGRAMPFWWNERLGTETILYTALLVIVAALIVGGIPALKATGPRMQNRLKHAAAGSTMRFGRMWTSVIVGQVAITVGFLLSVVAMAWSVSTILRQYEDVAFNRAHYMSAWFEVDAGTGTDVPACREELLRRLQDSPEIVNVTCTTRMPGADQEETHFEVNGARRGVRVAHVGPRFFETFNRKLLAGRHFTSTELLSGAPVAIVDESFVRHALGGRSAVGQQIREAIDGEWGELRPAIEIIGVTADMSTSERKTIKDARLYRPAGASRARAVNVIAHASPAHRSDGLPRLAAVLREAAATTPAGTHLSDVRTLEAGGEGDVIEFVFAALGIVGAVALLLSMAGIYALISFTLARRTREIGIRIALGASPRRIVSGVLSKAFMQIGLGVALGVLPGAAIVASVSAADGRNGLVDGLFIGASAAAFVLLIAAACCSVPLRGALRIEPMQALRTDA